MSVRKYSFTSMSVLLIIGQKYMLVSIRRAPY